MKNYNFVYITADGRCFDSLREARSYHWSKINEPQYRGLFYSTVIRRRNLITGIVRLYSCFR